MRKTRIYQAVDLVEGMSLELNAPASNHLLKVLRCRVGDPVILFNGKLQEGQCEITQVGRRATVRINVVEAVDRESPLKIHLGQVISRGDRMDLTIQKAIELGVSEITPLFSERCEVKLPQERVEKKLDHWQHIVISACEQSGRTFVPTVNVPIKFQEWVRQSADAKVILDHRSEKRFSDVGKVTHLNLCVGPEGGFSPDEIEHAAQNDFVGVQMGPRVLRTETAALTAVSILQSVCGDF